MNRNEFRRECLVPLIRNDVCNTEIKNRTGFNLIDYDEIWKKLSNGKMGLLFENEKGDKIVCEVDLKNFNLRELIEEINYKSSENEARE
jgi:hypothetical protein